MLNILYAGCLGPSPVILAQFTLKMYDERLGCQKFSLWVPSWYWRHCSSLQA